MKVQLERKVSSCSDQLRCIACNKKFIAPTIRTLLCTDAGFIHGDLCPECMKLKENGIRQNIRTRSRQLLLAAEQDGARSLPLRQQALELLSLSQETLTLPNVYQWFFKRLEILSEETQELQAARFGLNNSCACGRRSRFRIKFED